jgi:hypothetical protein
MILRPRPLASGSELRRGSCGLLFSLRKNIAGQGLSALQLQMTREGPTKVIAFINRNMLLTINDGIAVDYVSKLSKKVGPYS